MSSADPSSVAKGVGAGVVSAGVLGICTIGLGWPVALALLPAAATLGGAYLILRPGGALHHEVVARDGEFKELIETSRKHVARLRAIAADQRASTIRPTVNGICATSNSVLTQLVADADSSLPRANSLETTLSQAEQVLNRYLDLLAGTLVVDDTRKQELRKKIEAEFLPAIASALQDFARRLDEGDVIDLEASIRATMVRLQLEGL